MPVTTFSPIAVGGTAQQPITSFEYKNVGVNIDITPRVHHDGDVTLNLKLEISSVGPLFQNLPTFNSRTVNSVIRLKDGETNILAGLISDDRAESLAGLPGLANLPVLGKLFSRNRDEAVQTDIVMTLTRTSSAARPFTEEDLRSFSLGSETSPLLFEVPAIPPSRRPRRGGSAAAADRAHPAAARRLAEPDRMTLTSRSGGRVMSDPRVGKLPRIAVLAVAYLISPVDLIPEMAFPIVGFLDDITLVWMAVRWLVKQQPEPAVTVTPIEAKRIPPPGR